MKLPFASWWGPKLAHRLSRRRPDIVIGGNEDPYLRRWYVIPHNRWLNIYLHQFCRSDDDRALHDHPWPSCSILLDGCYIEVIPLVPAMWPRVMSTRSVYRQPGEISFRTANRPHRVVLHTDSRTGLPVPCWTLFITGPRVREWGFWCPQGWRHWKDFTTFAQTGNSARVGRGCET